MCVLCENAHRALFSKRGAAFYLEERETINRPAFYADGNKIKALVCSLFVPSAQKHIKLLLREERSAPRECISLISFAGASKRSTCIIMGRILFLRPDVRALASLVTIISKYVANPTLLR
jgi:hypothetical protein